MPTNTMILKKAPIFADLSVEEQKTIAAAGEQRTYAAGAVIFEEGSRGDAFYLVESGAVEIAKNIAGGRRKVLTRIETGQVFGEIALFDSSPRSANATADGDSRLLVFPKDAILEILQTDSGISFKVLSAMLRLMCIRLRATNEKLKEGIVWGFQVRV